MIDMCQKYTTALAHLFSFIVKDSKAETTHKSNSSETVHIHHNHGRRIPSLPHS